MPTAEIAALPVAGLAAGDCALFLWGTAPMEREAHRVLEAWGFAYKSQFVWVKRELGPGYWNRNRHEILLLGTRGRIPAPAPGRQWGSVIEGGTFASGIARGKPESRRHSEKPIEVRTMIEEYFPTVPRLELFARANAREEAPWDGWDTWGNESPGAEDAT
jgi:N6-adenosine-specific RNA methylase IME4